MKRFSSLIVLALFVVVGGVYATWNYATGVIDDATSVAAVSVTGKGSNGNAEGTINVAGTITLEIDDNGSHKGVLKGSGELTISFTADPSASADVRDNGITVEYKLSAPSEDNKNAFQSVDQTAKSLGVIGGNSSTQQTITAADVIKLITLAEISLPTVTDYDNYVAGFGSPKFTITVSRVAV